jgi:hypothetical protein
MTSSAPRRPSFDRDADRPAWHGRPATTKALAYWESLRGDLVELLVEASNASVPVEVITVPAVAAEPQAEIVSSEIDYMRASITGLRDALRRARREGAASAAAQLVADRLYEVDGEIFRTFESRSTGNLYAKIWTDEGWEYAAGAIRRIRPEHRMTVERAIELSVRFTRCIRCGADLTAAVSVERGIGPVCITKI